jgi:hypothetical protein
LTFKRNGQTVDSRAMNFPEHRDQERVAQAATLVSHVAVLAILDWLLVARLMPGVFDWKRAITHLGLIAAIDGVILASCGLIALVGSRRRWLRTLARATAAIMFAIVTLAQVLLSVGDHYSLAIMGRFADARLIRVGALEGSRMLADRGGVMAQAGAACAVIFLVIGAIAACRWIQSKLFPPAPDGYWRFHPSSLPGWIILVASIGFYGGGFDVVLHSYLRGLWRPDDAFVALVPQTLHNTTGYDTDEAGARQRYRATAPAVADPRNIVIIVADSLRADHLPNYGYPRPTAPFLSKLQSGGHLRRVETAASTCSESICGAYAILAATLIGHASPDANFTLHNLLKDRGYNINFVLSGTQYENYPLPILFGPLTDFSHYTDGDSLGRGTDDRGVVDYLQAMPASDGHPNLFFIWLMSSHAAGVSFLRPVPFLPTPSFSRTSWFLNSGRHSYTPEVRQEAINDYDNGVAQADSVIAQVFSILGDKGYLANSVVFITGDHGEGLGERGLYAHGRYLYGEFVRIPLLIYDASATAYKNLSYANLTDIPATVLDLLGLPEPASWEGQSLMSGPPRTVTFTQNDFNSEPPCRGVNVRQDGFAPYLIQCERDDGTRSEEVFDMTEDPLGLQAPVTPLPPALLDDMRARLDKAFPLRKNQFR